MSDFTGSNFSDANFSQADLWGSLFSQAYLNKIISDDNTSTEGIELIGKDNGEGFNSEWDDLKSNKSLGSYILSAVETKFKEKILKDNPYLRKTQYNK